MRELRHLLSVYFHAVGVRLKGQMQYRVSFLTEALAQALVTGLDFAALALLFSQFPKLRGWTLWEVGLLYAMVHSAFALAELAARGFDTFSRQIREGAFDAALIRPYSPFFMTLCSDFHARRVGRLAQALTVGLICSAKAGVLWTPDRVLLAIGALIGGACFFVALFVIGATLCFWTVESIELINIFTHGGIEAANVPVSIYHRWFRNVFIFVVPLAWVNYFPALHLLQRADPLGFPAAAQVMAPLVGVAFLCLARLIWATGVRHYQSTGS